MTSGDPTEPRIARDAAAWPRPAMAALAALSAALVSAALVVTWHNLRYSYARTLDILGSAGDAAGGGGMDLTTVVVPDWVAPFMQDLSVVSPALVLFTAARMLVAALLLLRRPASVRGWGSVHFPFPDPYKVYFIQMGLLGTIVGFVLAFAEVDPRAERQSVILLEALGTALWSTLTALVLAYVLCPVVEAIYRRARALLLPPEPRDTRSAIDTLRERTVAAAGELDTLAASTRLLAEESRALGAELRERRLDSRVDRLEGRLAEIARALEELREEHHAARLQQTAFANEQSALAARVDLGEGTLERHADELAGLNAVLAPLPPQIAALDDEAGRGRAVRARLEALETWLRTPPRERDGD